MNNSIQQTYTRLTQILQDRNSSGIQFVNRQFSLDLYKSIIDKNTQVLETKGEQGNLVSLLFLPEKYKSLNEIESTTPIIFFTPGASKNQSSLWAIARLLAETGIPVVTWDPRGKGFSEGTVRNADVNDYRDDAIDILHKHFKNRSIVLAGHSYGGTIVKEVLKKVIRDNDKVFNLVGIINHASSELNPIYDTVKNLRTKGGSVIPSLINGVSKPIYLFDDGTMYNLTLSMINKAVCTQESIRITKSLSDKNYPKTRDVFKYNKTIPVVVISVTNDEVFPLETEIINILGIRFRRPGSRFRLEKYKESKLGPVKLIIEEAPSHSAITLRPELCLEYLENAYNWILNNRD